MKDKEDKKYPVSKTDMEKLWESRFLPRGYHHKTDRLTKSILVFVIRGNIKITVDDSKNYTIYSQEMFIMQQDYSYNIDILKQTHLITCILHTEIFFAEQLLINQLLPLCKIHPEILTKLTINKTINDFLILIHDYIDDGIQSYSFYESKRNEFLFVLSTYYSRLDLAQFLYFIIYENIQFKEFIMNHYLQVKNVQELAALANYSTSGFIKKFQRCFNQSPYGWMQKQKAKQIAVDIKQGIKSLQEIAVEYKFSSYQHFSSFCKKQMGFPPTELLK